MLSFENGPQSATFLKPTLQAVPTLPGMAAIVCVHLLPWKLPFQAVSPRRPSIVPGTC